MAVDDRKKGTQENGVHAEAIIWVSVFELEVNDGCHFPCPLALFLPTTDRWMALLQSCFTSSFLYVFVGLPYIYIYIHIYTYIYILYTYIYIHIYTFVYH